MTLTQVAAFGVRSIRPAACGSRSRRGLRLGVAVFSAALLGAACVTTASARTSTPQTFNVTSFGAVGNGTTDSTTAIRNTIAAAQGAGAGSIVYFPTGNYALNLVEKNPNSLTVAGPTPIVLRGDGRGASMITELQGKNLLNVLSDGTVIDGLTLDAQTTNARSALVVNANNTLLEHAGVLGGSNTFAAFYPGPAGASRNNLIYATGNQVNDVVINDQFNLDGFSYSYQANGLIQNVDHTGSRLALFIDHDVVVQNYAYHPGTQPGGTSGFWITPPSNNVTVDHFTTDGNGGVLGANTGGFKSTNITISNLAFNQPGFHLSIGEVEGLTISNCNFGTNSVLRFNPDGHSTGVVVKDCTGVPVVRFVQPSSGTVSAEFDNDTFPTFTPIPQEGSQTFLNSFGGPTDFTVKGGTFQNCAGGFFKGTATTFSVSGLAGFPCTPDTAPAAALSVTPGSGTAPVAVTADASASTDTDATPIANYRFDFGDGTVTPPQAAATASHTYTVPATRTVTVTVTDTAGLSSTATAQVIVAGHPDLVGNPGFETDTAGWAAGPGTTLARAATAHSGSFAAQVTRSNSSGRALLTDSPDWNRSTLAGSTCTISAWIQAPAKVKVTLRTRELQGTTAVATHTVAVNGTSGNWLKLALAVPVVNGGDDIDLALFAPLASGQVLLVDDVSEVC